MIKLLAHQIATLTCPPLSIPRIYGFEQTLKKAHSDLLMLVICHFHKNVFFLKLQNALSLNVQFVFTHQCFYNTQAFRICKQKNETGSSTMFSFSLSNRLYLKYPPSPNILLEGLRNCLLACLSVKQQSSMRLEHLYKAI